ncbi:hypothetical protein GCM10010390_68490 [Streptomyces mordarskii]|uniref:Uncharacterized protein n=1 Tax=Streptomyces mordarskii TaxID=1226758 RepID=A0ABN1E1F6_9ACTN
MASSEASTPRDLHLVRTRCKSSGAHQMERRGAPQGDPLVFDLLNQARTAAREGGRKEAATFFEN